MTSTSNVLAIGTDTSVIIDKATISRNRKAFFAFDFEERMQKILLNGGKPLAKVPDDKLLQRYSANELKKQNGQHYYDFGVEDKRGWFIDVTVLEPKGVHRRVQNKISKEHWVSDNVARFSKDSRDFIQATVSDASDEEKMQIYQYLCYLNDNYTNK